MRLVLLAIFILWKLASADQGGEPACQAQLAACQATLVDNEEIVARLDAILNRVAEHPILASCRLDPVTGAPVRCSRRYLVPLQ